MNESSLWKDNNSVLKITTHYTLAVKFCVSDKRKFVVKIQQNLSAQILFSVHELRVHKLHISISHLENTMGYFTLGLVCTKPNALSLWRFLGKCFLIVTEEKKAHSAHPSLHLSACQNSQEIHWKKWSKRWLNLIYSPNFPCGLSDLGTDRSHLLWAITKAQPWSQELNSRVSVLVGS